MNRALARGSSRTLAVDQRRVAASRRASPPDGFPAARARRARTARAGAPDRPGRNRPTESRSGRGRARSRRGASGRRRMRRKREAEALLAQLLVELGEEHAGQVADRLRVEEIELHEALDRRFPGPVGVMHDLGDARLIVEVEPLLGASGEQVQMAAHRPEEALGAVEAAELGGGQQARRRPGPAGRSTPWTYLPIQ